MLNKEYYPLSKTEKPIPFHLKETTLGNYKKLRLLSLRSSTLPVEQKMEIINEFKLKEDEFNQDLGVEEFFYELFKALFLESHAYKDVNSETLNMGVLNTALRDFFTMLKGNY